MTIKAKKKKTLWNYCITVDTIAKTLSTASDRQRAAADNQLLAERNRVFSRSVRVLCRVWASAHSPWLLVLLMHLSLISNEMSFNSYLFVFSLVHTRPLCCSVVVVLVLRRYQESTLLWRPWVPLMKIKLCVMNVYSRDFIYDVLFNSGVWTTIGFNLLSLHRVQRQGDVSSAFNPSLVMKEQWAAVKRPGVQCLAHGHFHLQVLGRAGIEPTPSGLQDDPLTPLSHSRPFREHSEMRFLKKYSYIIVISQIHNNSLHSWVNPICENSLWCQFI